MSENNPSTSAEQAGDEIGDEVNLVMVIGVLAVLVLLVAGLFWALPSWFGSSTITVNVRN